MRYLCLAGLFCGLGLGTKYNGLISFFLLTSFIPILYVRSQLHFVDPSEDSATRSSRQMNTTIGISLRGIQAAAIFVLVSLLVFSPWMVRNLRWTGNPIYPLYQKVFNTIHLVDLARGTGMELTVNANVEPTDGDLGHFVLRKKVFNETFLEMVTTPVRIFFQGQDDNPKFFDGRLNPYLFFFPFFAFVGLKGLSYRQKRENLVLFSFSVFFLLYTFLQIDMRIRYIAPIIPPLVVLSVIGLYQTISKIHNKWPGGGHRIGEALLVLAVVSLLSLNAHYLIKQFGYVNAIPYLTGHIGRDDYIALYRKEYPAIQFINQQLPPRTRLLALYLGNRIYYSDREMVCDDNFFKRAIASAASANALADTLQSHNFSHLLIRADLFKMFTFNYLSADQRQIFTAFLKTRTHKLFSADVYHVLEITDPQATSH